MEVEKNLLNGKARGWAARTEPWKKAQIEKEQNIVKYAMQLYEVMLSKKEARMMVMQKFGICEKSFYVYMNKWSTVNN